MKLNPRTSETHFGSNRSLFLKISAGMMSLRVTKTNVPAKYLVKALYFLKCKRK